MATPDDYDTPWKDAVTRYFPAFMAFYFPLAHALIDWSREHVFLEPELAQIWPDAALGRRIADKLVQVTLLGGARKWVLVHLEVQGRRDSRFAERMFIYNYRIFDRYHCPVASLALLADNSVARKPAAFGYRLFGCSMDMAFPVVRLQDFACRSAQLLRDPNPFALVTLAYLSCRRTKGKAARRAAEKWRLARLLFQRNWGRQAIMDLFKVIDWMMRLPEPLECAFWRRVEERRQSMPYITSFERIGLKLGMEKGLEKGREQGLQEGVRQGQAQLLEQMLQQRFGALPKRVQKRLARGSTEELLAWSQAFVDATTLEQVFPR
ncbi:DUF4351 domain-containing protein [Janthinobacterium fluminis]|uniref:Transposase n=1 Tax=Janthinobacterium fluminis TaxID=2987524 RepID=A0ABT5K2Y1_9BURK|nr:DUF4351 domain-containing protein [Janthinobacterium fluminis]MDC8759338.1 transposase [Janthinobacterium fluminis]